MCYSYNELRMEEERARRQREDEQRRRNAEEARRNEKQKAEKERGPGKSLRTGLLHNRIDGEVL